MEDLLHWAVQNSDPERLKEVMHKYKDGNLTLKDVYGKDVMDALFRDESADMRVLNAQIADYRNTSLSDDQLLAELERLEEFVEQIDNAGNLHRMGGLAPLLELGTLGDTGLRGEEVRTQALLTLGIACQNNPPVQQDLVTLGAAELFASRLTQCGGQAGAAATPGAAFCGKLLFAVSALVKNSVPIQDLVSGLGVFDWLVDVGAAHESLAVARKSMALVTTVLAQNPTVPFLPPLAVATGAQRQAVLARAVLAHVRGQTSVAESDVDTPDTALKMTAALLQLRPMMFGAGFRADLAEAAAAARARCERAFAEGDELCGAIAATAQEADAVLAARDVADDEL